MAIEFLNTETEAAFQKAMLAEKIELDAQEARAQKIRRGLFLVKNGLYWGGIP